MSRVPQVSVGLPVFQGEAYVDEAIRSIRNQTLGDFELILSDNGSTDRTDEICRAHASTDPRIAYHRSSRNRGAAWNFNRTFSLARGHYFKWMAHDDVILPDFLSRCVEILDGSPDVVVAHTGVSRIDASGKEFKVLAPNHVAEGIDPVKRFSDMLLHDPACKPVFGLIRRDVLARTGLLGTFNGHDRPLVAELALRGKFAQIPDVLFLNREHAARSMRAYRTPSERIEWFDPALAGRPAYRHWRLALEYHRAIRRAASSHTVALRAEVCLGAWAFKYRRALVSELLLRLGIRYRPRRRRSVQADAETGAQSTRLDS